MLPLYLRVRTLCIRTFALSLNLLFLCSTSRNSCALMFVLCEDKVVVELGSGTGLSGLAARAAGASRVVLTDCGLDVEDLATDESCAAYEALAAAKRLVPLTLVQELRSTAQRNLALLSDTAPPLERGSFGDLLVARLDWHEVAEAVASPGATPAPVETPAPVIVSTQPETPGDVSVPRVSSSPSGPLPEALRGADVVIGSDLVYYPEDIAPLVATVKECLKGPGPKTAVGPISIAQVSLIYSS